MQLQEALTQISEIRQRMARTQVFRGYRSATVAFSAVAAVAAAVYQAVALHDPRDHVIAYLYLWIAAAAISAMVAGAETRHRCRRAGWGLQAEITWLAVEQFLPCLVGGAMITYVLLKFEWSVLWMLPGLWSILFSMGGFASCRLLPRPMFWAAGYYLIAGCACLIYARGEYAFSPWAMGLTFGIGQSVSALILYWTLERQPEPTADG